MMRPLDDVRLTIVLDRPEAVYSGMVPGFVAGDYRTPEIEIDVVPLARRARARCILSPATRIDPVTRHVELEGRPAIRYDLASLDVGATVRGLDRPGVRERALATRPIRTFVDQLDDRLEQATRHGSLRVVVVGAGSAGVELCCALQARISAAGLEAQITQVFDSDEVLPGAPRRFARRARRELEARGVRLEAHSEVLEVTDDTVVLGHGSIACDLAIWATGAAPLPLLAASPLPLDQAGFVQVEPTLQVVGHPELFAVGDCASISGCEWMPKAGVYAVREGPVLDANLRARIQGRSPRPYRPQRDYLSILNLGHQRALAAKWGVTLSGGWVWRIKNAIDRRFMRRFQVLSHQGSDADAFPTPEQMQMEEMACGGCAAKVGAGPLSRALARLPQRPDDASVLVGLDRPDDAAALALPRGDVVLTTVDAFRAFTDDPWLVGRVAAINAASDVLAKGGRPRHALALVNVPEEDDELAEESLYQALAGVRAALDELSISLVGGHSTSGESLYVGLAISGEPSEHGTLLGLDGLQVGDRLLLTRPLGTGVLLAADMQGRAKGAWGQSTFASMLRSNANAARCATALGARACTDVSGFGLAGHLGELLRASRVSARLDLDSIPALPGAIELLARGLRSTYHDQNRRGIAGLSLTGAASHKPSLELLFDPQTSGGLLVAVSPEHENKALRALRAGGDPETVTLGEVTPARADGGLFEVHANG